MPNRFSFYASKEKIKRQFNLNLKEELQSSYNIGVGNNAYVITSKHAGSLDIFQWGLIPHWAKDSSTILPEAISEGISTKHSFRMPIRQRRCLVLADSYYIWAKINQGVKAERILLANNELMAFAAVWDIWESPKHEFINTFAIITTVANDWLQRKGCSRMPALLSSKEIQENWLNETARLSSVLDLLKPLDGEELQAHAISGEVENIDNNHPDLHRILKD